MAIAQTLYVYGDIGGEVEAQPMVEQIKALPDADLLVRINSGGGSVFEASAIFNALAAHRGMVRIIIDGLAASAASYIAMAGRRVEIAENALLMIHDPWVGGGGNSRDLRQSAELLDKLAVSMRRAYAGKSGKSDSEVAEIMAAETWFAADEAVAAGFADAVIGALDVAAALVSDDIYAGAPSHIRQRLKPMKPKMPRAGEKLGAFLMRMITEHAADHGGEAAVRNELMRAADIQAPMLDQILDGSTACPTLEVLRAFAGVLGVPVGRLTDAAAEDGCDYSAGQQSPQGAASFENFRAAEQNRRQEIRAACAGWRGDPGVEELERRCVDDMSCSADRFRSLLLNQIGQGAEPLGGYMLSASYDAAAQGGAVAAPYGAYQVRPAGGDFMAAATDGILMRYGLRVNNPHPAARDFRGTSVRDLAAACISRAGKRVDFGGADATIRAALTTSDFPALLENTAQKAVIVGLESDGAATHRDTWTRRGQVADFKEASRVALSEAPDLEQVNEAGEITYGNVTDAGKETIQAETYARIVSISRKALVNDDLGELTRVPQAMGLAAARKESDLVYQLLADNPAMRDGNNLFSAAHSNDADTGTAITVESLGEARAAMRKQRGVQGLSYMNITPAYLVVGADRETEALQILAEIEPDRTDRAVPEWMRRLTLVVDPRVDDLASGAWYLAGDPRAHDTFEVAFLDGSAAPSLDQEEGFDTLNMRWRVVFDLGVSALDWRALYRNAGA